MANTIQKFLLNELGVRGAVVHVDSAWQTVLTRRTYPENIAELLGQAVAATLLMSSNIKFEGQLMMQLQSPSDLSLLVVQSSNDYHFRALARHRPQPTGSLLDMADDGLIAIILEAEHGKTPYQGVVGINSDTLAGNLATYFNQSEQLQTLFVLRANQQQAAGIFLQVLPDATIDDDDWQRLQHLTDTLNLQELQNIDAQTLITRIFAEDDKTLYPAETVTFDCGCSDARTLAMLANLEVSELEEIVATDESVVVACDFCGQQYSHDAATIAALLANKIHPN